MEEYLEKLLSQIRCTKAHPFIKEEIRGHIEDQIEENMHKGMSQEEAEAAAVRDMGDPVQAGISLDAVHKPQTAWGLLLFVAVISALGMFLQMKISAGMDTGMQYTTGKSYIFYTIAGILLMGIVQYLDYTWIARFAKQIGAVLMLLGLYVIVTADWVNGSLYYLSIGSFQISSALWLCYVPVYAAILFRYYGQGYKGLFKCLLWLVVPVLLFGRAGRISQTFLLLVCLAAVLSIAVSRGWLRVSKGKVLTALWAVILLLPMLLLFLLYKLRLLAAYQTARLTAFAAGGGEANYVTFQLRRLYQSLTWTGSREKIQAILPSCNADYIFTYIWAEYGRLAGILLCCMLGILLALVFRSAFRQKNELGFLMGCSCGVLFLVQTGFHIIVNLGIVPNCASTLPFLSAGGGNILLSYILMGIVLSIYRYKNIYPRHTFPDALRAKS